jgi:hypothetical protein
MSIVIGIGGKKASGKSTVAEIIKKRLETEGKSVLIVPFAEALKDEVGDACGVSDEDIEANKAVFRPILQWWGTEFRKKFQGWDNYWVEIVNDKMIDEYYDAYIIPDVRFLNEAKYITGKGGYLIKVKRGMPTNDTHASETELDNFEEWHRIIENNSTIDDLTAKLELFLYEHDITLSMAKSLSDSPSSDSPNP